MNYKYKISVIILPHDNENNLKITLDSLFSQTFKNFEIIIINKKRDLDEKNIALDYCRKYKIIFLFI